MPQLKSSFIFKSKSPNFTRDSFSSLYEMRNMNPAWMNDGHIIYCKETNKHYTFNSGNQYDEVLGYFRDLKTFQETGEVTNTLTHIIYNTLDDMKNDNTNKLNMGQLVYCRQDKNHYYYAFDDTLDVRDPNQITFDPITGYFRLFIDNSVEMLKNELQEIKNAIWPLTISVTGSNITARQGYKVNNANITWSITQKGQKLIADYITINGVKNTDSNVLASNSYLFNAITSSSLNNYKSTVTNKVEVFLGKESKSANSVTTFIYPKYYGWITGTVTQTDAVILTGNNIFDYVKKNNDGSNLEILTNSISQTINIPENVGMGRWFYIWPSNLGSINSIVDAWNFNQMDGVDMYDLELVDPVTNVKLKYNVCIQTKTSDIGEVTIKIN
jgi:hypothetical protein